MASWLLALIVALGVAPVMAAEAPDEAINLAFDRQKGKIYAVYARALREQPTLKGRVDLEFTVAKDGKASGCRVVRSELGSIAVEDQLCTVIEAMDFGPRKGASTVVKRIDFHPG
jgi:TonB family protein